MDQVHTPNIKNTVIIAFFINKNGLILVSLTFKVKKNNFKQK